MAKASLQPEYGKLTSVAQLGAVLRAFRKQHGFTLQRIAGLTNVSMRFLSELERGKETAEIGKAFMLINKLGLELSIYPRGHDRNKS